MDITRLGMLLLACNKISDSDLKAALDLQWEDPKAPLGELLIRNNALTQSDLEAMLAAQESIRAGEQPDELFELLDYVGRRTVDVGNQWSDATEMLLAFAKSP